MRISKRKFVCLFGYSIALLILLLAVVPSILSEPARYYAGYQYLGHEGAYGAALYGEIYTIDPYTPKDYYMLEWITIILKYSPLYWVQLGYARGYIANVYLDVPHYYIERNDADQYNFIILPIGPRKGEWHSYYIEWPYGLGEPVDITIYRFYIDSHLVWTLNDVNPSMVNDYQAFVETTTGEICIDGSHFRELIYYEEPNRPSYWETHIPRFTRPYSLIEVSHYEFYAYGGG